MDTVIVGAGLAGLHCALRISERYPRQRIVVLESYSMAGGRVSTFTRGNVHWEAGAGRIPESHRIISSYCDRYGLTRFPISSDSGYLDKDGIRQNIWNNIVSSIQKALSRIPSSKLGH
jgi:protoporphyrinogen oxidase